MPTTTFRNVLYRAALPFLAPSPRHQMTHETQGHAINLQAYERILCKHYVLGSSLLLTDSDTQAAVHTSVATPMHVAGEDTLYRVASITKMATALVTLMLCSEGCFALDDPIAPLLPQGKGTAILKDVTVRQLLSHTSGLRDTPAYEQALAAGRDFHHVLCSEGVRASGHDMIYCNFGFGLLGCILEHVSGQCIEALFREKLFIPLGMEATLDASTLQRERIMPISRVLPYHSGQDVVMTKLGQIPLLRPDPLHHFGHTAGAMYTNAPSLSRMLKLIANDGAAESVQLLSAALIREMKTQHSYTGPTSAPTRRYGLGLVILDRPALSSRKIYGHQGFAYGCVDAAFFEDGTNRQLIFLNGGCSEAREGRLGLCNKAMLKWAFQKEIPSWK